MSQCRRATRRIGDDTLWSGQRTDALPAHLGIVDICRTVDSLGAASAALHWNGCIASEAMLALAAQSWYALAVRAGNVVLMKDIISRFDAVPTQLCGPATVAKLEADALKVASGADLLPVVWYLVEERGHNSDVYDIAKAMHWASGWSSGRPALGVFRYYYRVEMARDEKPTPRAYIAMLESAVRCGDVTCAEWCTQRWFAVGRYELSDTRWIYWLLLHLGDTTLLDTYCAHVGPRAGGMDAWYRYLAETMREAVHMILSYCRAPRITLEWLETRFPDAAQSIPALVVGGKNCLWLWDDNKRAAANVPDLLACHQLLEWLEARLEPEEFCSHARECPQKLVQAAATVLHDSWPVPCQADVAAATCVMINALTMSRRMGNHGAFVRATIGKLWRNCLLDLFTAQFMVAELGADFVPSAAAAFLWKRVFKHDFGWWKHIRDHYVALPPALAVCVSKLDLSGAADDRYGAILGEFLRLLPTDMANEAARLATDNAKHLHGAAAIDYTSEDCADRLLACLPTFSRSPACIDVTLP